MELSDYIKDGFLKVAVKTGKSKTLITGYDKNTVNIDVNARPEKGKANAEIVKFISKQLKKKVEIKSGFTSKVKILRIT